MCLIWPLVWLSVQWEASQTLHSHQRVYVLGVLTGMENCIWGDVGMWRRVYWDVWVCEEMQRGLGSVCVCVHATSTGVYKSNQMIVPPLWSALSQQAHFSFFPSYCPCTSFLPLFLLLLLLLLFFFSSGTDLSGGPCLISSSAGCWETGDKF